MKAKQEIRCWASTRCERVSPPIGNGAYACRPRNAATQRIAGPLQKLTPNRCAAARQLMPSSRTAETTRLRKSTTRAPSRAASDSRNPLRITFPACWEHRTISTWLETALAANRVSVEAKLAGANEPTNSVISGKG